MTATPVQTRTAAAAIAAVLLAGALPVRALDFAIGTPPGQPIGALSDTTVTTSTVPGSMALGPMSSYPMGMPSEPASRSTRSFFLATLLGVLAQGLGSSLSQGMGGSITRWFEARSATPASTAPPSAPANSAAELANAAGNALSNGAVGPSAGTSPAPLYAGIAFEVHAVTNDGAAAPVDPAQHVFHTGDRFMVFYRPNLPGRVDIFNLDPQNRESRIDASEVGAGQLVTLGPYRFVDTKGAEVLRIVLSPCDARVRGVRNIARADGSASAPVDSPMLPSTSLAPTSSSSMPMTAGSPSRLQLSPCSASRPTAVASRGRRDIQRVVRDGDTSFALDAIDGREIEMRAFAPREISIAMTHR